MQPDRPNRAGVGMFELVLMAIIGVCVYALVSRNVRDPRPARVDGGHEAPAVAVPEEQPPAPAPPPDVEPAIEPTIPEEIPYALPESLDAQRVRDGVALVTDAVARCGDRYPDAVGVVKLSVKVAPDGSVVSVKVAETDSKRLGTCAAAAMRGASFSATQQGGSFTYPFEFGER